LFGTDVIIAFALNEPLEDDTTKYTNPSFNKIVGANDDSGRFRGAKHQSVDAIM
jgi:hypothetical protein